MSNYNSILLKIQKAVKAHLDAVTFTWVDKNGESITPTVLRGVSASTKVLPAIIVECNRADHEPTPNITGNWIAECEIRLRENADDVTEDLHLEHAGEVFDQVLTSDIAAQLNVRCGDYLTVHYVSPGPTGYNIVERSWESAVTITMTVAGGQSPYTYDMYSYDMGLVTEAVVEVIDMAA